ncbi:peroxidase family protein [Acaryochloris sp. CCMEE 5410]|uniref:peroxidase family protein n=1 Tax=Acaryochloris sp. CCMEE 5410 TaxID=310037 RepID=UPI000248469A|nr:peroxidase family protein [Acaryochloris sp. CCMEE 5410]KAI9134295.1 peroxidase [Acaryochloris sp. CCMEE 5410]
MSRKPWHQLKTPLALIKLLQFRNRLRENNLHDTAAIAPTDHLPKPKPSPDGRHFRARTDDGSFNDLDHPEMGMAGTRFGRNVPLQDAYPDEKALLTPNPREISRKVMTRDEFIPATILNVLAAAWIQFENHDWFSHGDNQTKQKFQLPLADDDDWPAEHHPLEVGKTAIDETRKGDESSGPPTFINTVTHWWDGSQIYGSDSETVAKLRSHKDGKLTMGDDGLLPLDDGGVDSTGFNDNWWVGLSLLHTLFAKEHNFICDRLKAEYPSWSDDQLFDQARLINAALTAKIHTAEWTPAILPLPATDIALNVNWAGFLGEDFRYLFGHIGEGELLSGIPGSSTDHHTAPYYLTEEFVSVYRMHPLIPDDYQYYDLQGKLLQENDFMASSGKRTRALVEEVGMDNLFYSLGITHPGAVTLHNFPRFLQLHKRDNGEVFDLAAVDILRDRERGVPRYNRFRELIGRSRVKSFEEITSNPVWAKELREVYNNDINAVDLMVGMFAEDLPDGFGFSDTAFRVFILMASRRLKSDRFLSKDYRAEIYTPFGLEWIYRNNFITLLKRHYPKLAPALVGVSNGFAPWRNLSH